jgi:hypothetical protein
MASQAAIPSDSARGRWLSAACWGVAAISTSVAGAIASFIVGGFAVLVVGMAIVAALGGGTGEHLNHIEFLAMLVLAPAIVGANTFLIAMAAWRLPRMTARRASPPALAVSSALTTLGFVASHRPGYIAYVNKAPSILAYIAATTCAAAIATALLERRTR